MEFEAINIDDVFIWELSIKKTFPFGEAFEVSDFGVISFDDSGWLEMLNEDGSECLFESVAGGIESLDDEDGVVTVDDGGGDTISFAMNESISGLFGWEEEFASFLGVEDALFPDIFWERLGLEGDAS